MTQVCQLSQDLVFDLLATITQPIPSKHAHSPAQIAEQLSTALESSWGPETFQEKMNDACARLEAKAKEAEQQEILDRFLKSLDEAAGVGKCLKEEATGLHHRDCTATITPECAANTRKRKRDLCDDLDRKMEELEHLRKKLRIGFASDTDEEPARDQEEVLPVRENWAFRLLQCNDGFEHRSPSPRSRAADHNSLQENTPGCETQTVRSVSRSVNTHRLRTPSSEDPSRSWRLLNSILIPHSQSTPTRTITAATQNHANECERLDDADDEEEEEEDFRLQPNTPPALTSCKPPTFSATSHANVRPFSAKRVLLRRRKTAQPRLTKRFIDEMDRRLLSSSDRTLCSSGTLWNSECGHSSPSDGECDRGSDYGDQEQTQGAEARVSAIDIKFEADIDEDSHAVKREDSGMSSLSDDDDVDEGDSDDSDDSDYCYERFLARKRELLKRHRCGGSMGLGWLAVGE